MGRREMRLIGGLATLLAAWGCTSIDATQTLPWEGQRASASSPEPAPDAGSTALPERVSFGAHILPLFERKGCVTCHNASFPLGGLDLSTVEGLLTTGAHAPVLLPCDPNGSVLVQKVRQDPPFGDTMPPPPPLYGADGQPFTPASPGPLTEYEFALLQLWILGGGDPAACAPSPVDAGPDDAPAEDDASPPEDASPQDASPPEDAAPPQDVAADAPPPDVAADPDVSVEDEEPFVLRFEELSYPRDIVPWIQRNRCLDCHGGIAGYYMGNYNDTFSSGLRAPHIIPCQPDQSTLLRKVLPTGPYPYGGRMPTRAPYVSADDVAILRQWIAEGAQEVYTPGFCD